MKLLGCLFSIPVLLVVLFVGLVVWMTANQQARVDSYTRSCVEAGGHIYQPDSSAWCLTDDGRWIEVYP